MSQIKNILSQKDRHLKWKALDNLERGLMVFSGLSLAGFTLTVFFDVLTRTLGSPWLWLQEVTIGFFVYGVFLGAAVATRRNEHLYLAAITESMSGKKRLIFETINRLIVLGVSLSLVYFGYINFLFGFGSYLMPSMTPIAVLYAAIPLSGLLITLFVIEQLVNGWRNGFETKHNQTFQSENPDKEVAMS